MTTHLKVKRVIYAGSALFRNTHLRRHRVETVLEGILAFTCFSVVEESRFLVQYYVHWSILESRAKSRLNFLG